MGKRNSIPKATSERVLKEYSHKCAICANDNPHLHHIDEDPSNSDPMNLIPLCPNCHLIDQHNPTRVMDPRILQLFREHKDPTILSPQFHPLFKRFEFLFSLEMVNADDLSEKVKTLLDFVQALEMGSFYSKHVGELLKESAAGLFSVPEDPGSEARRRRIIEDHNEDYRQQLLDARDKAIGYLIELIRYQEWNDAR